MGRRFRMVTAPAAVAAATLALAACSGSAVSSSSDDSASTDEIVIGALHPLTGDYAADGQQMDNAAQMAVDAINEAGGIASLGGAQLVLESGDTQGKAEVAQSEATRLIQDGAVALLGTYQSAATANVASVAERNKVPFVIDVSSLDDILDNGYTYTFRMQPNATTMGTQGADYLVDMAEASGIDLTQVAYLYEQGNYGQATYEAFAAEAEAKGVTVSPAISYDATSVSDMTTQVKQVAASGAQVLAVSGYYRDSLLIAQAVDTVQPDLDAVYGVADGAFDLPQFVTDAPGGGENYFDVNYHYDATNTDTQQVMADYQTEYGEEMRTSAVLAYDAVQLIAAALEDAGSADTAALRDAISSSSYEPLVVSDGPVSFDETGENTNAGMVVDQVLDGEVTQVFPEDLAVADPKFVSPVQ